jgi:predicted RNA binding protein YcfA (HicA-like mRNA interferase family)
MKKYTKLPAITGRQLIRLLKKDGWQVVRTCLHGLSLMKDMAGKRRITTVQDSNESLPKGTLNAILSEKQTGLGHNGLRDLLNKYGLK